MKLSQKNFEVWIVSKGKFLKMWKLYFWII